MASLPLDVEREWHGVEITYDGASVRLQLDSNTKIIQNLQYLELGSMIPIKHVTYHGDNSYLRIPSETKGDNSVYSAAFDLRTYDINATLLFVDMGHGVNITVDLEDNMHLLAIYMDGESVVQILYELYTGGIPNSMGFKGCMKDVLIDGKDMDLSRLNPQDITMATVGRYVLKKAALMEDNAIRRGADLPVTVLIQGIPVPFAIHSCNCDAGSSVPASDSGYLSEKSHLPVTQVRFGDTGTIDDDKEGRFRVGPVVCQGDTVLDNTVTFNKLGASTKLPLTFTETPLDLSFQFRTGIRRAYLIHAQGLTDPKDGAIVNALAIRLSGSFSLVVDFILNKKRIIFKKDVTFRLNDNRWHSVYFEFNVIEATVIVDGETGRIWRTEAWTPKYDFRTKEPIVVGNSLKGVNGFLGCMRELQLNGRYVDLIGASKRPKVSTGVQPDLGAHIKADGGIMYRLDKRLSEEERIFRTLKFGFKTTRNLGVLTHITNAHPGFPDFISIELGTDGRVLIYIDVGHGEDTIHSSAGKVNDGKIHHLVLTYNRSEEEIVLKVDTVTDVFNLTRTPTGVDTVLDTPKRLYIARVARTVPGAGFEGCIFRLLYNDHPVLQDVFLNPTPQHVFLVGRGKIRRSSCGLSESVPREIRQLHGPQPLPPGNTGVSAPQSPIVTNLTARVSLDVVETLERSHVMAGFQEVTCRANGAPSPIYTWLKNGGPLSCPHLVVPGGLLLMPEDDRLDGSYQCVAHNANGRALSDKVHFQAPRITALRSVRRHKLVIREGGFLRLECSEHVDSLPATKTSWLYKSSMTNNTRIFQSPTGALNILPVMQSDTGSNFTCVKTNELLDVSIKVKVITLTVIRVTVKDSSKSAQVDTRLVYKTPPPLTAFIGQTVRLECLLKGEAAQELKWHRQNITDDATLRWEFENNGRQLLITNVTESDQGWYFCSTSIATYARFFVDITSPPIWTKGLKSTTVYRGDQANFTCVSRSAAGEPLPRKPRWFKNGRRLLGDKRHTFRENNTILTIKNVTKEKDFQTIQCNVSNHRGYSFAEAVLDIVEPLQIVAHTREVSATRGETVSIQVSVTLDKKLDATFTWLKTDQHIGKLKTTNSDPRKVFKVTSTRNTSTLTLNTQHVADEDVMSYTGYYVCVVTDGVGERTTQGKIVITLPLSPQPGDDSSILYGLAIAITLGVVFIGAVVGIICITRRRKKGRQDEVAELPLKSPVGSTS
ncbi:uncharacterized protein LOC135470954 [Liolophura sinensis]|uniref:uncharacterized protein LOC135470954 n=1 Tax=Liolophura sinensis TaxID=3198878 RepID=UPI0031591764